MTMTNPLPDDYRPGDRVRVSPIGDPPFIGTVEAVGKRTVSVREDPAIRSVVWSRSVVEPAPTDAPESVLVSRETLEALLADATEALDAIPNTGRDYVRDRVQNIADNTRALLGLPR